MRMPKHLTIRAADSTGRKTDVFEDDVKALNISAIDMDIAGDQFVHMTFTFVGPPFVYEGPATIRVLPELLETVSRNKPVEAVFEPYEANVRITSAGMSPNTVRVELEGELLNDVSAIAIHLAYGRHEVTISRVGYDLLKDVTP